MHVCDTQTACCYVKTQYGQLPLPQNNNMTNRYLQWLSLIEKVKPVTSMPVLMEKIFLCQDSINVHSFTQI